MDHERTTKRWVLGVGALLLAATPGCWFEEDLVDRFATELDASASDVLVLAVDDGDLEIVGDPAATRVEVDVEIWSRFSRSSAMDHVDFSFFETTEGEIRLTVSIDEEAGGGTYAHLWVRVPSRFVIDGRDRTGDVWIRGVESVVLVDDSGDLDIRDVRGDVAIEDESGDVVVRDVRGRVSVEDDSGDVEILGAGSVDVVDRSGDVNVETVEGDVSIDDGSGNINLEDIGGHVLVNDGSGDIVLREVDGIVSIRDGEGDIRVGRVGELRVLSDRGGSVRRF